MSEIVQILDQNTNEISSAWMGLYRLFDLYNLIKMEDDDSITKKVSTIIMDKLNLHVCDITDDSHITIMSNNYCVRYMEGLRMN